MTPEQLKELGDMLNPDTRSLLARYLRQRGIAFPCPRLDMTLQDGTAIEIIFSDDGAAVIDFKAAGEKAYL